MMKTSDRGIAEIASHEGIVPYPYKDSKGIWTFGLGHTASAGPPNPATLPKGQERSLAECFQVFRRDLGRFEARVNAAVKVPLQQNEFDALVSFDFNTGGIDEAKLVDYLNAGNRAAAAAAFMNWSKPVEIIPRRQKEQALFRDGVYAGGGFANIYKADAAGRVQWSSGRRVPVMDYIAPTPEPKPPLPEPDSPIPPAPQKPSPTLRLRSRGPVVREAQALLRVAGQQLAVDGVFGHETRRAVIRFQSARGLVADGVVGPQTWKALRSPPSLPPKQNWLVALLESISGLFRS